METKPTRAWITPREMQILEYICEGLSNGDISSALGISQATVKQHVMNTYTKLGARSRSELIIVALRTGLVVPSWMPASLGEPSWPTASMPTAFDTATAREYG